MKRPKKILSLLTVIFVCYVTVFAGRSSKVIPLRLYVETTEKLPVEIGDKGQRMPLSPTTGTINRDTGVTIPGVCTESILQYEAYDSTGECLAVFSDEKAFVDYLYTTEEVNKVQFITAEYVYYAML